MKSREDWDGTFDGLNDWEKIIAAAGYEIGWQQAQRKEHGFSDSDIDVFAAVIRRKRARLASTDIGETADAPEGEQAKE